VRNSLIAGPWLPDLAPHGHDGLVKASGVYPLANGYEPIKSLEAVTTALPGLLNGGAFIGSDGTSSLIAGTATDLSKWSGAAWSSVLGGLTAASWQFAQFGDIAIGVHGGAPVKYNLLTGVAGALGGSPPPAKYICIGGNFVVLAGDPANNATVTWSGFNAGETWTGGTNQSDDQPLPDGGKITGLAGHENYFLVFQRDSINRFSYIGPPAIFQRDKISTGVGCIAPGSIAQSGSVTFFLSERGFMQTDGTTVTPIGDNIVDQTFMKAYQRSDLDKLSATVDPRRYLYKVSMFGRLWIYNWALQRWTDATLDVGTVFTGFTSNISLEALDALYPGGVDTIPVSLDSPIFQGGEPRIYGVKTDGTVCAFSGPNVEATFTWCNKDFGQRARVHMTRPITDAVDGMTLTINARARLGDSEGKVSQGELRPSGHMPIRCNGRFLTPEITIAAGTQWTYFQALDLDYGMGGGR
jgi:hypothetical protein